MAAQEIPDAAALAATTDCDGVVSPGETDLGVAWLDLRDSSPSVAVQNASWVTRALSSCLRLQGDAALVMTTGILDASRVATQVAESLASLGGGEVGIAVIRGENVLGRLEEFLVDGCDLKSEDPPHRSIREAAVQPAAALAAVPPSTLRAAMEGGARVILCHTADRESISSAVSDEPRANAGGRLTFAFPAAYRLELLVRSAPSIDDLRVRSADRLPASIRVEIDAVGAVALLRVYSEHKAPLLEAQRLVALTHRLGATGSGSIETVYDRWSTAVPIEMLDFGYDLQTADEWLKR